MISSLELFCPVKFTFLSLKSKYTPTESPQEIKQHFQNTKQHALHVLQVPCQNKINSIKTRQHFHSPKVAQNSKTQGQPKLPLRISFLGHEIFPHAYAKLAIP
jgi:hypothetical protein